MPQKVSKKPGFTKIFESSETFRAYSLAKEFCREHGISYGSSCACSPTALLFGDYSIAKWRNLNAKERSQVHGTIEAANMRQGPVTLHIKPEFAHLLTTSGEAS
jgi:hypothetical protein